ncbi:MAG: pilus assembly protein PilM [Phycisphaerae bacterium]|nr:pilus assembly protein PilM [Phycisphaerae bacterium]
MGSLLTSFMNRDYSPIGLDIGHDSMKMLQLRRRAGGWEVAAGGIHIFTDEARENPGTRWRQIDQGLRALLGGGGGRAGFRSRQIVVSLDYEQALVKNARLPKMPAEELGEAVRWEAADRFPFDVAGGQLRYLVAGDVRQGGEQRQEVLMFAVEDQTLRDMLRTLDEAKLHPVGLDAHPIALARAAGFFMPCDPDPDSVQALADIGSHSCQVLISRAGRVVFFKSVDIGSRDLTRAVIEKVGTSLEDTNALRLRLGRGGETQEANDESQVYRAVAAAMRPVADRLAQEITLCLRYYSVTFRGNRPECVYCVGGASHDQLLMKLLEESLSMKVAVCKPLASCNPPAEICQWGGGLDAGGPEWAVAFGCCLKPIVKDRQKVATVAAAEPEPVEAAATTTG